MIEKALKTSTGFDEDELLKTFLTRERKVNTSALSLVLIAFQKALNNVQS